jgi:acyl-CoA synthetase (AMP-forming)/AMP-acid ligase II
MSKLSNAAHRIDYAIRENKNQPALWLPGNHRIHGTPHRAGGALSFGELDQKARRAASLLQARGIKPLDKVLLAIDLSYDLYAWVIAAARLGATILLVEPWLKLSRIEKILDDQKPKFFVAGPLGSLWGLRIKGVRSIPHKISGRSLDQSPPDAHRTIDLDMDTPCLIAFTSGTTGDPKGLVRTHRYLNAALDILNSSLGFNQIQGPDLVIFANFTLANLANGRASLIMPARWSRHHIRSLHDLPDSLKPVSITTGPAYMQALLEESQLATLRHIHIGGALTENSFFEKLFVRFSAAHISHIYGSSEVEPVALIDARIAVRLSREQGFFHTLSVGNPVERLKTKTQGESLWVSGPHVSPEYLGNPEANQVHKSRDQDGNLWHRMGDRITNINNQWFYQGREHQSRESFGLEQKLYTLLGHGEAFLEERAPQQYAVYVDSSKTPGLKPKALGAMIKASFPEVSDFYQISITKDKRHRARIDRPRSKQSAHKLSI